jgi:hypothetical protein
MNQFTRRKFIKTSAIAGAAVFSARSWAQVAGANSDIRVAVIGLNGRGRNHVSALNGIKGVRVVALCDPDTAVLEQPGNWRASMPLQSKRLSTSGNYLLRRTSTW